LQYKQVSSDHMVQTTTAPFILYFIKLKYLCIYIFMLYCALLIIYRLLQTRFRLLHHCIIYTLLSSAGTWLYKAELDCSLLYYIIGNGMKYYIYSNESTLLYLQKELQTGAISPTSRFILITYLLLLFYVKMTSQIVL
jgi:hypothetical protein